MQNRNKYNSEALLEGHVRPNSKEAEEQVIGTILSYSEFFSAIGQSLSEDSFYDENLKEVFKQIQSVVSDGDKPDIIAVQKNISLVYPPQKARELIYSMAVCRGVDPDTTFEQSVKILEHYRQQRVYLELGEYMSFNASRMTPNELSEKLEEYHEKLISAIPAKVFDKYDVMSDIRDIVQENENGVAQCRRTYTGFRIFDEEGGFNTKKLILVGAGSSQGKSAFALSIARQAMIAGQNVAIYSMEMDRMSIGIRLMNNEGLGLKESTVLNDRLLSSKNHLDNISRKIENYSGNFFIDDRSKSSVEKIIESIRDLKRKHNVIGVIIDYVQILNVYSKSQDNAEKVLADCARLFQQEAKQSDVWIMLLSQISRNPNAPTHDPSSDRLRGSGQLFEACDMNILIYRPEVYDEIYPDPFSDVDTKDTALLKLCKNRGGRSHKSEIVHFYGDMQLFEPFGDSEYIPKIAIPQPQQNSQYKPF